MEEPLSSSLRIIFEILFLIFLIYLSAFFSGSETALTSMGKLKLKEMLEKSKSKDKKEIAKEALHRPNRLLTTILICNNLVNILASSIATVLVMDILPRESKGVAVATATGVMTFLILIFGEITPKIYAKENAEKVFERSTKLVDAMATILKPILWILMGISNIMVKALGGVKMSEAPFITEDELVFVVEIGKKEGILEKEEGEFLSRILDMKNTDVREIMVPRVDMVCIEDERNLLDLIELIKDEQFSRIPVYHETVDNIVGICYAKDVLSVIDNMNFKDLDKAKVREIMRDVFFVPETMKISSLLKDFKKRKIHMAIVVDEFGGTSGIVTLEDILEYIVGEIMDEYDTDEISGIKKLGENLYVIDAKVPIADLEREIGVKFPKTEFETIGGYLLELFERVPKVGEEMDVGKFHFRILAASRNRIDKIEVSIREERDYERAEGY
ncbi:MAG: HlyC/CorC family transporter [Thermotogae bacterium]|nr:HlyC/CorC family transporter [Thermotogota bacterium]